MMIKKYSNELAKLVDTHLSENDWHYSFDEERGLFHFNLVLNGKMKRINFIFDVKEEEILLYAMLPMSGDEEDADMMARLADYTCRANHALKNGNFELDMESGSIRYKAYIDCEDILPSQTVIGNAISRSAFTCKKLGPGYLDVIFAGATAEEAERNCSGEQSILRQMMAEKPDFDSLLAMLERMKAESEADGQ